MVSKLLRKSGSRWTLGIILLLVSSGASANSLSLSTVGSSSSQSHLETESSVQSILAGSVERLLSSGKKSFLTQDHLGNITVNTNEAGQRTGHQSFTSTGHLDRVEGITWERGFTGQEWDRSTDLTYFKHRLLDTSTGRWLSPDPLFAVAKPKALTGKQGQSTTAYAYVANNGVNLIDPTGLEIYSTKSMEASYASERTGQHNHPTRGTPTWYMSADQRSGFEVSFNRVGQAVYSQSGAVLPDSTRGTAFVMNREGTIYARVKEIVPARGQVQHSSFLAGGDVAAAGMMSISGGKITNIHAQSGHYAPGDRELGNVDREIRSRTRGRGARQNYRVHRQTLGQKIGTAFRRLRGAFRRRR